MLIYYIVMAALSVLFIPVLIILRKRTQVENNLLLMFILILISNCAYLAVALSDNQTEALLAVKLSYIGGCFMPPLFLAIVFEVCNFKAPRWVTILSWGFSLVVFCCAITSGYNDLFYKNLELVQMSGISVLHREYGPLHMLFPMMMLLYMTVEIGLTIYSLLKKSNVSYKNALILVVVEIVTILSYIVSRAVLSGALLLEPAIFILDDFVMLYLSRRLQIYNLRDNISLSLEREQSQGYITFDTKKNFLGCNDKALSILPELESCRIDCPISPDTPVLSEMINWIDEIGIKMEFHGTGRKAAELTKEFSVKNRHLKCKVRPILIRSKIHAYLYEISDNTMQYNYTTLLSSYNTELEEMVKQKTEHIANIQLQLVLGMSDVIENRDGNTGGHVKRTSDVVGILVDTIRKFNLFDLSEEFCQDVIKAAPMHDLGKIAIPDAILNKPGKLTDEEFETMKSHAVRSAELCKTLLEGVEEPHFVKVATNVARHHHEKWDGTGYPDHLKGEEIPFEARIMALADVYDALVSERCYKKPMSFEQAAKVIEEDMGRHFDPNLSILFALCNKELEAYYKK